MTTSGVPAQVPAWVDDLQHLDGLDEAVLAFDNDGRVVYANQAALRRDPQASVVPLRGAELPAVLGGASQATIDEIMAQVLGGDPWHGRLEITGFGRSEGLTDLSCTPLLRDGQVAGAVCVLHDPGSRRGQAREVHRLADRLRQLARVATALTGAEDAEAVNMIVISEAADVVGATVASLSLLVDPDTLALVALRGGLAGASNRWSSYSVHAPTPAGDVVRSGERMVLIGKQEIRQRYPDLESATEGERSMIALPLTITGRTLGVVTFSFPGARSFDVAELEFFGVVADSCAQALERMRAQQHAAEQTARIRFLADATTQLSANLDYHATLRQVARLVVPAFADWCAVDLLEDDRLHRLAVEHVDPEKVRLAMELHDRYPPQMDAPNGGYQVARTRTSELVSDISEEMLEDAAQDDEHAEILRALRLRSALSVPLVARGRVLGVMTWVSAESDRVYEEADVSFAEDLGLRAALAIDNAQLHSQTRKAAVSLQRAVLPDALPTLAGWEMAAHYSAAGRTEVGGDFYDVIPLGEDRLAVFVGDVMGRGVEAAAAMAQMRAATRAYIAVDPDPEVVLRKLDLFFATYAMEQLVTMVYLVIDPAHGLLHLINAGHPPPVVLSADGTARTLGPTMGPPLGLATEPRTSMELPLGEGDTLLAFTDGLIERREEDIDHGQLRLLRAVHSLGTTHLETALGRLVEEVRDPTRDDDIAAVAVRHSRAG